MSAYKDTYLRIRGSRYHYQRRPPAEFKEKFKSPHIQVTLKTDSLEVARQRAAAVTSMLEDYFLELNKETCDPEKLFKNKVNALKRSGFKYASYDKIADDTPLHEVINRVNAATVAKHKSEKESLLGQLKAPKATVPSCPALLFEYERLKLSKKTPDEIRKYKNPVLRAFNNFETVVGDKPIEEITRTDLVDFKDWWIDRIIEEDKAPNTANRDFTNVKKGIRIANDRLELGLRISDLFIDISLQNEQKNKRAAFAADYVQNVLLKHQYNNESDEIKLFIFAMADTGCRIKELVGLEDQDVILDASIPHIHIRPNTTRRSMKTKQSKRTMPLVGSALYAFQQLGGSFKEYLGRSDAISATANKYLRTNGLLPSEFHSLYSLRHSFKDRLTAVEAPKNIELMLMGHASKEPNYGDGASLEQKKKWLDAIAFKI